MIVDAHHHFWDPTEVEYTWMVGEAEGLRHRFLAADLAPHLAAAKVDQTVLVQAEDSQADTHWMLANAGGVVGAVVVWVPFDDPRGAARALDRYADSRVRGVRTLLGGKPRRWVLSTPVLETLRMLARRNLVLDYPALFPDHLDDLPALADAVPGLTIVLDHLASPPVGDETMYREWAQQLAAAATRPNVVAKLSGLATGMVSRPWSPSDLRPYVDHALATFGPDRLLYGSDWPVCLLAGEYGAIWAAAHEVTAELSEDERAAVFGGNAARVYRL